MPSDDSTVATQADFVPMAVGNTDRVRSVVSVSAHDGFSHQPRSGMQQRQLNVLTDSCERRSSVSKCTPEWDEKLSFLATGCPIVHK
mgnify:CR=1 FL=1